MRLNGSNSFGEYEMFTALLFTLTNACIGPTAQIHSNGTHDEGSGCDLIMAASRQSMAGHVLCFNYILFVEIGVCMCRYSMWRGLIFMFFPNPWGAHSSTHIYSLTLSPSLSLSRCLSLSHLHTICRALHVCGRVIACPCAYVWVYVSNAKWKGA